MSTCTRTYVSTHKSKCAHSHMHMHAQHAHAQMRARTHTQSHACAPIPAHEHTYTRDMHCAWACMWMLTRPGGSLWLSVYGPSDCARATRATRRRFQSKKHRRTVPPAYLFRSESLRTGLILSAGQKSSEFDCLPSGLVGLRLDTPRRWRRTPAASSWRAQALESGEYDLTDFLNLPALTLAELHVCVLTSFIKLIKLFQKFMKLLPNHIMV